MKHIKKLLAGLLIAAMALAALTACADGEPTGSAEGSTVAETVDPQEAPVSANGSLAATAQGQSEEEPESAKSSETVSQEQSGNENPSEGSAFVMFATEEPDQLESRVPDEAETASAQALRAEMEERFVPTAEGDLYDGIIVCWVIFADGTRFGCYADPVDTVPEPYAGCEGWDYGIWIPANGSEQGQYGFLPGGLSDFVKGIFAS